MKITKKELLDKYGIDLNSGKYHITTDKSSSEYSIYTVRDDSEGCILVGENKEIGKVLNSRKTMDKLMAILTKAEDITITIS